MPNPEQADNNSDYNVELKSRFCFVKGYEVKEVSGVKIRSGYIATTHLDDGFLDKEKGVYVRDKLHKKTLDKWAMEINEGNPDANKMSVYHNREPHVAGVMVKGSARVDSFPDGEYGLYVDTLPDTTREDYRSLEQRMDNGHIDSFSIEFRTKNPADGNYLPGAVIEHNTGSGIIRELMPGTMLKGATYASQPMNSHAVMIKELRSQRFVEQKSLEEEQMVEVKEPVKTQEEVKQSQAPVETKEVKVSAEDLALLKEFKTQKAKQEREMELKEIRSKIVDEVKEELSKLGVENKSMHTGNGEAKESSPAFVEFKEMVTNNKKYSVSSQALIAGKMADELGLTIGGLKGGRSVESKQAEISQKFNIGIDQKTGRQVLEYKSLGLTTNQNSDTDYLLSAAELSDVFDPVVYNALNQATTTWNILQKDDYSNKGNHQVQFKLKTAANASASFYTGNSVVTGNVSRENMQTRFKKAQVGIEVDGDMIAAARGGPIGDIFAREVVDSTDDLMSIMNAALYDEVGLETASAPIGFEYITDSAGNATLYNLTRSSYADILAPTTASDTYINGASAKVSKANLRAAIRQAKKRGAKPENLVFFSSLIQEDMIRSIYDDAQRLVPTSQRFGFEGMMTFDGVPVYGDKDCNDDDIFLVDLETHRIAVWVPPTVEKLGKDSDAEKAFIKTYYAVYNRAPCRMVQIYGNATS